MDQALVPDWLLLISVGFLMGWGAGVVSALVYGGYQTAKAEEITMSDGRRREIIMEEQARHE
jgi:hypothetical protein